MGRKLALGLGLLGAVAWLLLPARPGPESPAARSTRAADSAGALRVRPGVRQTSPTPSASEDAPLAIGGTVLGPAGPIVGARVLATAAVEGEALSTLYCEGSAIRRVFDCLHGEDAGQVVELVRKRHGEALVQAQALTGEDGSFQLSGLAEGLYAVWVESPRGVTFRPAVAAGTQALELRLGAGSRVSGTVTDEAKAPVAGALVTVISAVHSRFFETLTDAQGHYQLGPLPPGRFMAVIAREDLLAKGQPLWLYTPEVERDFVLQRPGRVTGQVMLAKAPVAAAEVRLIGLYGQELQAHTDAAGRFSFEGLRRVRYSLTAWHQGKGETVHLSLEESPQRLDVLLELKPAVFIEGVIRDEDQTVLAEARISAAWEDWGDFEPQEEFEGQIFGSTDEAGRYRLGPLPPGVYRLEASGAQYVTSREEARPFAPGQATQDFTLKRAQSVEGILEDPQGRPVAGESVTLRQDDPEPDWDMVSTGADGRFSLSASREGEYHLRVEGEQVHRLERIVTVPTEPLRLVVQPLLRIVGEVVDETGMPLPGVHVGVWAEQASPGERPLASDETDGEGRFLLHVSTEGRYSVTAELFSLSFLRTASQAVEVEGQRESQVRLRFEQGRPLAGRVVDWRGRPVPQVPVLVQPSPRPVLKRAGVLVQLSVKTDDDGRFALEQVSGEQLEACIRSDVYSLLKEVHGEARCARVKNEGQEVRLVLGRGVFVTGRLVHPDGSPVTHFRMNGREVRREDGEISLLIQQPGVERIELSAPGLQTVLRTAPEFPEGVQIQDLGTLVMSP